MNNVNLSSNLTLLTKRISCTVSLIKEVTGKKRGNGTITCVEEKDGTIKMEKDKILDRWSEYIGKL